MVNSRLPANPKDRFGVLKVSLSKFPAVAVAHGAHAMMDGARKYGAYNWRERAIIGSIYIDACKRHLDAWFDAREEVAPDSDVHHLGHALACIGIILDAEATGNLIDDRPIKGMITATYTKIAASILKKLEQDQCASASINSSSRSRPSMPKAKGKRKTASIAGSKRSAIRRPGTASNSVRLAS